MGDLVLAVRRARARRHLVTATRGLAALGLVGNLPVLVWALIRANELEVGAGLVGVGAVALYWVPVIAAWALSRWASGPARRARDDAAAMLGVERVRVLRDDIEIATAVSMLAFTLAALHPVFLVLLPGAWTAVLARSRRAGESAWSVAPVWDRIARPIRSGGPFLGMALGNLAVRLAAAGDPRALAVARLAAQAAPEERAALLALARLLPDPADASNALDAAELVGADVAEVRAAWERGERVPLPAWASDPIPAGLFRTPSDDQRAGTYSA